MRSESFKIRNGIASVVRIIHDFRERLDVRQKLYFNLLLLLLLLPIFGFLFGSFIKKGLLLIFIFYWSAVVIYDLTRAYNIIYSHLVGKALLLLGFTLCTNVALSIAGIVVNDITTVSPSNFPHAVILISIGVIPMIIAIVMLLMYFAILVTSSLWALFVLLYDHGFKTFIFPEYDVRKKKFLHKTTRLVQILSISLYCVYVYSFFQNTLNEYSNFLYKNSKSFIYTFEMYSKSPCKDIPEGKVAFIGDDKILHAKRNGEIMTFKIYTCDYKTN
ncbi:hypothetical protein M979_1648 [Buttiauxella noackiae ATCC 51607]|uniref:Uncharacterized protein n=1 Tax=Buttiauxella noackiae ATCC 51607 TaxID=1354255 RepID=A0A1B7HT36_9ENTR|nr:hypothetical protein [Buttiauxella noackiae]OAT18824.1 hypothetical protein M979_1648 [Buttiauxella noackiae ATCC 51607]